MNLFSNAIALLQQAGQVSGALIDQVRSLLFAAAIFILGLVVAEAAKFIGTALLRRLRWEAFCSRIGLTPVLHKLRADITPSVLAGEMIYWITLLSFFMQALQQLEVAWLSSLGRAYFEIAPGVLQAIVILLVCWLVAHGLSRLVLAAVEHAAAFLASGLLYAAVLNLGLYHALVALGLDRSVALPVMLIVLAGCVLGVALAWALHGDSRFRDLIRVEDVEEGE